MAKFITLSFAVFKDKGCKQFSHDQCEYINVDKILSVSPFGEDDNESLLHFVNGCNVVCMNCYSDVVKRIENLK